MESTKYESPKITVISMEPDESLMEDLDIVSQGFNSTYKVDIDNVPETL